MTAILSEDNEIRNFDITDIFLKFIDEEYVDSFINEGEIHFSPFTYFQSVEDNESGDPNEGSVVYHLSEAELYYQFLNDSTDKKIHKTPVKDAVLNYGSKDLQNFGLTSFFHICPDDGIDLIKYDKSKDKTGVTELEDAKYLGRISDIYLNEMMPFQQTKHNETKVPVLIFAQKFLHRISTIQHKDQLYGGKVQYYDSKFKDAFDSAQKKDIINILFMKTKNYSHQHEYRIVLPKSIDSKGSNIYLGNLEGIAINLKDEKALHQLHVWYK